MTLKNVTVTLFLVLCIVMFSAPLQAQRVIATPSGYVPLGYTVSDTLTTTSTAAAVDVATSPVMVYGLTVDTGVATDGSIVWANFFDTNSKANIIPGTSSAKFSVRVATGGQNTIPVVPIGSPVGLPFSAGIQVNCTTTRNGATSSANACHIVAVTKK